MKPTVRLSLEMCCTIERLCDEYERVYAVSMPDSVFYEMIVSLGIESMDSVLKNKADSMKMEV